MNEKELKHITLTDIHAQWLLMRSQVISFDEWRKDMLAWARWYKAQKERPMSNIDRQGTEDKAS